VPHSTYPQAFHLLTTGQALLKNANFGKYRKQALRKNVYVMETSVIQETNIAEGRIRYGDFSKYRKQALRKDVYVMETSVNTGNKHCGRTYTLRRLQ
jgi:hypothetical protein